MNNLFITKEWINQFNEYFGIKFKIENNKLLAYYINEKKIKYLDSIEIIELDSKTSKLKINHNIEDINLLKNIKDIEDKVLKNFNLTNTIVSLIESLELYYKKNINSFNKTSIKEIYKQFLIDNSELIKVLKINLKPIDKLLISEDFNSNDIINSEIIFENDFVANLNFESNIKITLYINDYNDYFDSLNNNKLLNATSINDDNFKQVLKHILVNVKKNNYSYFGQIKINKKIFINKLLSELQNYKIAHSGYKTSEKNLDQYTLFFNYFIFEIYIKENSIEVYHNKDDKLNLIMNLALIEDKMDNIIKMIPDIIQSFKDYNSDIFEEFEF